MKKKLIFIFLLSLSLNQISGNYILEEFESQYIHGQFANNIKGDMIIEYSKSNKYRLFYGIQKNGKSFFEENYIKKIEFSNNTDRLESKNIFVSFNNSNDNIQYLFSFSAYEAVAEIFDIERNINNYLNIII